MKSTKFTKVAKTVDEQIELLRLRGMEVDSAQAKHYLLHLNYYRLAGYWRSFEESHDPHMFKAGTRFERVLDHYLFDREFRLLLLDAIERIEVSVRTQWAYHLAHHDGAHAYLNPRNASSQRKLTRQSARLAAEIESSQEPFVVHLRSKYTQPDMPPVWAACEVLSLGQLSRWYELMRPTSLRSTIAKTYGLDQQVLESFLHHLTYVRNLCAHHSRVWNRELTIFAPVIKSKPAALARATVPASQRKIYHTCCFLQHLMNVIAPDHQWHCRLSDLISNYHIDTSAMGFPSDWSSRPLWASPSGYELDQQPTANT